LADSGMPDKHRKQSRKRLNPRLRIALGPGLPPSLWGVIALV